MLNRRGSKEIQAPRPLPGTRIGNYVVGKLLGQGGMGEVYLVEHPDIGTQAAVKVLGTRFSTMAHATERFKAEARAIARIKHPNVVEIHDYGTLEDGRLYYQMEHLEGRVLEQVMARNGKMTAEVIAPYLDQICAGLGAAHDKHIVHRDLKPENIIVMDGPPMTLKILDFGIAKLLETQSDSANTSVGVLLGTPIVMAPEQAAGQPERISFRTDLYSLGVILYWMLTGRPPFLDDAPGMLVSRHINDTPRPLLELEPTIPAGVATLVERCLAKDPADRPASALEVAAEFSEVLLWQPAVSSITPEPRAADKTGFYVTGRGMVPDHPASTLDPEVSGYEDLESSARTAVLPIPDPPAGDAAEEVPTLRDDQAIKTIYVGQDRQRRLPLILLVMAALAVILGVTAGILLSMTGGGETSSDGLTSPVTSALQPDLAVSTGTTAPAPVAISLSADSGPAARGEVAATPDSGPLAPDTRLGPPDLPPPPDLSLEPPPPDTRSRARYKRDRRRKAHRWKTRRRKVRPVRPVQPVPPRVPRTPAKKKAVPAAPAVINISTLYRDQFVTADIFLDGRPIGQSPLVKRGVRAGIHLVEARQKGYKRSSAQIRLLPGRSSSVVLNLRKK